MTEKCTVPVTFLTSFTFDGTIPTLRVLRALAGDDPRFVCISLSELASDATDHSDMAKQMRAILESVRGDVSLFPADKAIRWLVHHVRMHSKRHSFEPVHVFAADFIRNALDSNCAIQMFESCELAAIGTVRKNCRNAAEKPRHDAALTFEAHVDKLIKLPAKRSPAERMDAFFSKTTLRSDIRNEWRKRCADDPTDPAFRLLHPNIGGMIETSQNHKWSDGLVMEGAGATA